MNKPGGVWQGVGRGVLALCALLPALGTTSAGAQHVITRGNLTVTYQDASDAQQLTLVFQTWQKAVRDLKALGLSVPKVQLNAALNAANFTRQTGEGSSTAALTRGSTICTQRLSALARRGILADTIRHEAFHTAQPASLPRWLAEGLARVFSGEANRDPNERTGLEDLTDKQLNERLLSRTPGETGRAYAEATRRAKALVARLGWPGTLSHR